MNSCENVVLEVAASLKFLFETALTTPVRSSWEEAKIVDTSKKRGQTLAGRALSGLVTRVRDLSLWRAGQAKTAIPRFVHVRFREPQARSQNCYLDLGQADVTRKELEAIVCNVKAAIFERTGLLVSIGAGSTKTVAHLASQLESPGASRTVECGSERAFLENLPVQLLSGLAPSQCEMLAEDGVTTIGQFRRIPKPVLTTALGQACGSALWHQARGLDSATGTIPHHRQSTGSRSQGQRTVNVHHPMLEHPA